MIDDFNIDSMRELRTGIDNCVGAYTRVFVKDAVDVRQDDERVHLDEGADDGAHHVAQEAVGGDGEDPLRRISD